MHASIYLVSRVTAAGLNVISVAVFARLTDPHVLGTYFIGYALAYVLHSVLIQWLFQAYFARFNPDDPVPMVNAAILAALVNCTLGLIGLSLATANGWIAAEDAVGVGPLLVGLSTYLGAMEIGRSLLLVRFVAISSVMRAALGLALGVASLVIIGSPWALSLAIATAHLAAATPIVLSYFATVDRKALLRIRRREVWDLAAYGWPLALAAACVALSLTIDRFLLDARLGATAVGHYSAVGDFVRQSFAVVGEAVALAYISQARVAAVNSAQRETSLLRAFRTIICVAGLGLLAFHLLGEQLVRIVFPIAYVPDGATLLALAVGSGCIVLRAYYFGQMIYFQRSAWLEVTASLSSLVIAGLAGLLLVPAYGVCGAAAAFAAAQLAALSCFAATNLVYRTLPVDGRAILSLGLATATVLLVTTTTSMTLTQPWALGIRMLALVVMAGWLGWRWDLFEFREWLRRGRAILRR